MEAAWMCLMRSMDAGTLGGDSGTWAHRFVMLIVTIGGIFIVSTLIGILTSGIEARIEELRKGRSLVVETEHTLILGWSPQIFAIISELLLANANRTSACIAILADRDKVEMDDEIRDKVGSPGSTRIVCRTGSPSDPADLAIMSPGAARAVIVLSPDAGNPDAQVIKTLFALVNTSEKRPEAQHIVAEIRDPRNVSVARMIGKNEVEVILAGDLIARIAVQTVRQSGLSLVYTELLDFGGDEIYFQEEPALVGRTFGDAIMGYEESAIIGMHETPACRIQPTWGEGSMAARAIWKGVITFGGLEIPVKLYSAVQDRGIHFRLLHVADEVPVKQKMVRADTDEEVPPGRMHKGAEIEPGTFVLVKEEELDSVAPEESRTIEIERFVDPGQINHQWYERAYFLGPDSGGMKEYWALLEALEKQGKVGVARWVMRRQSYVGSLGVHRGYLVLISMRFAGEVVSAGDLPAPQGRALDRKELEMASQLVGMLADEFRPDEYHDAFRERVLDLVKTKARGGKVTRRRATRKKAPSSLGGALQASLEATRRQRHAA